MNELLARKHAVDAVVARFKGLPLVWGQTDCARLAAFVMIHMGLKPALSRFSPYSSAATVMRRLNARGFAGVEAVIDAIDGCRRVPFAFALPGDILALPQGESDFPALAVLVHPGKILFFDGSPPHLCQVGHLQIQPLICWKVTPPKAPMARDRKT